MYLLDPFNSRNGGICKIKLFHPPVVLTPDHTDVTYIHQLPDDLCQRSLVDSESLYHFLS